MQGQGHHMHATWPHEHEHVDIFIAWTVWTWLAKKCTLRSKDQGVRPNQTQVPTVHGIIDHT